MRVRRRIRRLIGEFLGIVNFIKFLLYMVEKERFSREGDVNIVRERR